jgi:hypothetical protein
LLITEPSRATPLIPVRLANDSFEDKIILFLSLDGFLENQNQQALQCYDFRHEIRITKKLISSTAFSCIGGLDE